MPRSYWSEYKMSMNGKETDSEREKLIEKF